MRIRTALAVVVVLLAAACSHAEASGVVDGYFRLPGMPTADLQRGGLNFASTSAHKHGKGNGFTVRVSANGAYAVALSPGSYTVIGALSGHPGGPTPETCVETMHIVVKAKRTTRADYLCRAKPSTSATPSPQ